MEKMRTALVVNDFVSAVAQSLEHRHNVNDLGQVVYTRVPLSPSCMIWYHFDGCETA